MRIAMGAYVVGVELAKKLVGHYVSAEFSNEQRHVRRLHKVSDLERSLLGERKEQTHK